MANTTLDRLLNGRFVIEQPQKGYRIAVDTLLLASAISAQEGNLILDLGCGVGGVMLAIACRLKKVKITGVEIQKEYANLCASNITRNEFEKRLHIEEGDATNLHEMFAGQFNQVVMNPPFHDAQRHDGSPNAAKQRAHLEKAGDIEQWIQSAAGALRNDGMMTMITRSDRQEEMVKKIQTYFNEVHIKPIWSHETGKCKRIILRGIKNGKEGVTKKDPFILYGSDGLYSKDADKLLRDAEGMAY